MAKARRDAIHDARDLPVFVVDDALIDRYGPRIGAYGVAVYATMARFAKHGHATVLAYQTIADALGIARSTAQSTIRRLADAGMIHIEPQTDDAGNPIASNRYVLLPIGDNKAETPHGEGTATRYPLPPHGTPLPSESRGYRHTVGGVPPDVYMSHDSLLDTSHDSPSPPTEGGGDGGDQKPKKTELYHWLRAHGVDSPQAAERNQHHDLALTQAMFSRMVGQSIGDDRKKRVGRFIRALEADGPTPTPASLAAPPPPPAWRRDDTPPVAETIANLAALIPKQKE